MERDTRLLAIDWGTSTARAYALDAHGAVIGERSAALGVQRVTNGCFADALAELCGGALPEGVPAIACGMIGSRQGWVEVAYRFCEVYKTSCPAICACGTFSLIVDAH